MLLAFIRRDGIRATLVLLFVLNVCFAPCIWGRKTFLESARGVPSILPNGAWAGKPLLVRSPRVLDPGAPAWQSEPQLAVIQYEYLHEKTIPLWNPYQAYGRPLAANMLSAPFFPLTAAAALALGPVTYNWYILLRLLLAGICTYLYLRLFLSFLPALAGGIVALLSGYYVLYITIFHLSVETLLPACLLTAEYI
ncbi:MAG: hypothetical protein JO211_12765, partial [Acidobacteriaceae bacterium]|nr:hypothetical protein [Acidobacteriaceae bacterium]